VLTTSYADAGNRLCELVDQLQRTHDRVEITRDGRTLAVLISPAELAALEETVDVLTSREAMRQLAESRQAVEAGDVLNAKELANLMASRASSAR
jgi:antitoxin YefM